MPIRAAGCTEAVGKSTSRNVMISLLLVGFVAELITGISPCILPVLPMVLVAGATGTAPASRRWRSVAVVAGLVVSFSFITLVGTTVLSALRLPPTCCATRAGAPRPLRPQPARTGDREILERPFLRLHAPRPATSRGDSSWAWAWVRSSSPAPAPSSPPSR